MTRLALRESGRGPCHRLRSGVNRVGTARSNDVVLKAPAVSRHHALVIVEEDRITVEDLASKNGTYLNDERVRSARIHVGDELRFGSATLRVEPLAEGEDELAIRLSTPATSQRGLAEGSGDTMGPVGPVGLVESEEGYLVMLERMLERLSAGHGGWLAPAVDAVAAVAVALLELPDDGPPSLCATAGDAQRLWQDDAWRRALARAESEPGPLVVGEHASEPPVIVALGRGTPPRAAVLWGGRASPEARRLLVRALVRLQGLAAESPSPSSAGVESRPGFPPGYVPGRSRAMEELYEQVRRLAPSGLPVLILGETGTGKDTVARLLHHASPRREQPFVAINCAAIPTELLEAELFGVAAGAATGVKPRRGRFQQASGGTLLLDEIGDMPRALQAKLLRALEGGTVQPIGGDEQPVDVWLLSATNSELGLRIRDGGFRSDLYYRLAGAVLALPPLRERASDIPALVEHFMRKACRDSGAFVRGITVPALQALSQHPWPGNVRELEHLTRRLVFCCPRGQPIDRALVERAHTLEGASRVPADAPPPLEADDTLELAVLERRAIEQALARSQGTQARAAALLGISRFALRRRMAHLGLTGPAGPDGPDPRDGSSTDEPGG